MSPEKYKLKDETVKPKFIINFDETKGEQNKDLADFHKRFSSHSGLKPSKDLKDNDRKLQFQNSDVEISEYSSHEMQKARRLKKKFDRLKSPTINQMFFNHASKESVDISGSSERRDANNQV